MEELIYHYTESRNFFRLKDFVSDIEVFSLTYTPHLKHTIVSLWQLLQYQMVDPVFEYNRSLEGFVTSCRPTTKELFGRCALLTYVVIVTQMSRFFKEMTDLETKQTPDFRRPSLM